MTPRALPSLVLSGILVLASAPALAWQQAAPAAAGSPAASWSYDGDDGPAHWGELTPAYALCAHGERQSPVAIDSDQVVYPACEPLRFRYRSSALLVRNDGSVLRLGYDRGSYLVISGLSYELVEVRFHVPGEHALDGRVAAAEIQLIHGNNRGDLAVVAVPVQTGRRSNQTLSRILEHAPSAAGTQFYGRNIGINPLFLLPGRKDYFAYEGSLTQPPCSEGVHWYVLATPVEVLPEELDQLARLVGHNARPLQRLGSRVVHSNSACPP